MATSSDPEKLKGKLIICRPVVEDAHVFIELLGENASTTPPGLRCRFVTKQKASVDVSVTEVADAQYVKCFCNEQVLNEGLESVLVLSSSNRQVVCKSDKASLFEEVVSGSSPSPTGAAVIDVVKQLSWIDRYLAVWILGTMIIGVLLGNYVPGIRKAWQGAHVATVSLPIAIGLWWMMTPVLCKVRYELMGRLLTGHVLLRHLGFSLVLNWLIGPALMTGLAWATLPDLTGYRNGIILVGIARCIAMVLLWNQLAHGNGDFCAVLVAFNSILQILLYSPFALFYLRVISGSSHVKVGFWTVAKSVLLFLGIPLAAGIIIRVVLRKAKGAKWYDRYFAPYCGPVALLGLLYTIFVMFSLQGHEIINKIGHVARVVVPLLIYFSITFFSTIFACRMMHIPYAETVTQAFTASSNNFELAIAVAVGSFGIDSDEALAAVVGPLIEVPVLIGLVYVALWLHKAWSWPTEGGLDLSEEDTKGGPLPPPPLGAKCEP